MLVRALTTIALFVSIASAASAQTVAERAEIIQRDVESRMGQACRKSASPAQCRKDFDDVLQIAATVQVRYVAIIVAMANHNDEHAWRARIDVKAYDLLLAQEVAKLNANYGN